MACQRDERDGYYIRQIIRAFIYTEASTFVGSVLNIPLVGFESRQSTTSNRFYKSLQSVEAFPLGYFDYSHAIDPSLKKIMNEAQSIMQTSRSETSRVLNNVMRKKGGNGKDIVFNWLGSLIHANDMQCNLLQDQLLDEKDNVHNSLTSKPFLVGTSLSVLEMCCRDLVQAYEKKGVDRLTPGT